MASLARKIEKRKNPNRVRGPGMGQPGTPMARVIMKMNPKTGNMQEFHVTKGWKK